MAAQTGQLLLTSPASPKRSWKPWAVCTKAAGHFPAQFCSLRPPKAEEIEHWLAQPEEMRGNEQSGLTKRSVTPQRVTAPAPAALTAVLLAMAA